MTYNAKKHRIVKIIQDDSITGGKKVITEDGEVWAVVDYLPVPATGDRQGIFYNGHVREF